MKSIILIPFGILSAILFCSCGADTEEAVPTAVYMPHLKSFSSDIDISNKANRYDTIGVKYRNFLSAYKSGNYNPGSYMEIKAIVESLTNSYQLAETQELLSTCMSDPTLAMSQVLEQSNLSLQCKELLGGFINNYQKLSEQPFSSADNQIVAFEDAVNTSLTLTDQDQLIILSVTSITRYSLYQSCCEDTDWGKSVGNIVAAMAGAIESNSRVVQYPLITSIAGLEKIQF